MDPPVILDLRHHIHRFKENVSVSDLLVASYKRPHVRFERFVLQAMHDELTST